MEKFEQRLEAVHQSRAGSGEKCIAVHDEYPSGPDCLQRVVIEPGFQQFEASSRPGFCESTQRDHQYIRIGGLDHGVADCPGWLVLVAKAVNATGIFNDLRGPVTGIEGWINPFKEADGRFIGCGQFIGDIPDPANSPGQLLPMGLCKFSAASGLAAL